MVFWWELLKITCVSSLKPLKDLVINKVTQGTGNGEIGKLGNGGIQLKP
jgi:hypothetical protein